MSRMLFALLTAGALLVAQSAHAQLAGQPHDLKFIAPDAIFAGWSKPAELMKNPELAKLAATLFALAPKGSPLGEGVGLGDIESAKMVLTRTKHFEDEPPEVVPIWVIRFVNSSKRDATTKAIIPPTFTEKKVSELPQSIFTREYESKGRIPRSAWKISTTFYRPDDETLMSAQAGESLVSAMTYDKGTSAPAWAKQFATVQNAPLAAVIDLKQVREQVKAQIGGRPMPAEVAMMYGTFSPLWELADLAVLGIETSDGIRLTATAYCPTEAAAKGMKEKLEGVVGLGKSFLPMVKQPLADLDTTSAAAGTKFYGELEAILKGVAIVQTGTEVKLTAAMSQSTLVMANAALVPAIKQARAQALRAQGMNNMRQLALAMLLYHDANKCFPASVMLGPDGKTPHSWRVALLPYLEEKALYEQYKLDEPWDSENNKKVGATIVNVYRAADGDPASSTTRYVVPTNPNGIFTAEAAKEGTKIRKIIDGTSKTLLIVEAETAVPWTKPEDLPIEEGKLPKLGPATGDRFYAAMADGSVRAFSKKMDAETFWRLVQIGDGHVMDWEELGKLEK